MVTRKGIHYSCDDRIKKNPSLVITVCHHLASLGYFVDLLCFFCLVFAMPLCASVYMCFVVPLL